MFDLVTLGNEAGDIASHSLPSEPRSILQGSAEKELVRVSGGHPSTCTLRAVVLRTRESILDRAENQSGQSPPEPSK